MSGFHFILGVVTILGVGASPLGAQTSDAARRDDAGGTGMVSFVRRHVADNANVTVQEKRKADRQGLTLSTGVVIVAIRETGVGQFKYYCALQKDGKGVIIVESDQTGFVQIDGGAGDVARSALKRFMAELYVERIEREIRACDDSAGAANTGSR